jgi:GNAT superfamily N-acetyltransferase
VLDGRLVVAFYASSTAVLMRSHATKRAARNQPNPLPAVLLGRLAVETKYQGRGFAAALLKHFVLKSLEVAEITGVRLLLVHAKNDTARHFYPRHGFEPSPVDDLTLMLLVKDVRPSSSA